MGKYLGSAAVYLSSNSGATWTKQLVPGLINSYGIASSGDGSRLAVAGSGSVDLAGAVFTSTDYGASWIARGLVLRWLELRLWRWQVCRWGELVIGWRLLVVKHCYVGIVYAVNIITLCFLPSLYFWGCSSFSRHYKTKIEAKWLISGLFIYIWFK